MLLITILHVLMRTCRVLTLTLTLITILHVWLKWDVLPMIFYLASVLDSKGYHNRSLQTWWFKTTGMCSLTGIVARSLRVWQGKAFQGSRGVSVPRPFSFWWLQESFSLCLQYSNVFLHLCMASSHSVRLCVSLIRTLVMVLGPRMVSSQHYNYTCKDSFYFFFSSKFTLTGSRG